MRPMLGVLRGQRALGERAAGLERDHHPPGAAVGFDAHVGALAQEALAVARRPTPQRRVAMPHARRDQQQRAGLEVDPPPGPELDAHHPGQRRDRGADGVGFVAGLVGTRSGAGDLDPPDLRRAVPHQAPGAEGGGVEQRMLGHARACRFPAFRP
jgi:hypothetical protein